MMGWGDAQSKGWTVVGPVKEAGASSTLWGNFPHFWLWHCPSVPLPSPLCLSSQVWQCLQAPSLLLTERRAGDQEHSRLRHPLLRALAGNLCCPVCHHSPRSISS